MLLIMIINDDIVDIINKSHRENIIFIPTQNASVLNIYENIDNKSISIKT